MPWTRTIGRFGRKERPCTGVSWKKTRAAKKAPAGLGNPAKAAAAEVFNKCLVDKSFFLEYIFRVN
jgi:hypothetical protein